MDNSPTEFLAPSAKDRFFNRLFGLLVKLGIGPSYGYLLEVKGRKSGRIYSTPVNVMDYNGKKYLVAPRGHTQWVKNLVAGGGAALVKGGRRETFGFRSVPDEEKPEILKAYLERYKMMVQSFFPVAAGSPPEAFRPLASRYPVFEITQ